VFLKIQTADMKHMISSANLMSAFRHKNYPLLFLSTVMFSVGHFMMMIALGWLVLEKTDSSFLLGMIWVARTLPFLIFGALSGAISDKIDRRILLISTGSILALCSFLLGVLSSKENTHLGNYFLFAALMGSTIAFDTPSRQAFVFDIVGKGDAMSAISMNGVALRIMGVFGGLLAGVTIQYRGVYWCFYIMSVGYLLGVLAIVGIRGMKINTDQFNQSVWHNIAGVLEIIRNNRVVLALAIMAIICEIFGFSFLALLPVFARDVLQAGALGLGWLNTTQSAGALMGVLFLASLGNYTHKGRLILGIFLLFGIFLIVFSQSSWYFGSLVLMVIIGAMASSFDAMQHTLLQLNVIGEQRGRAVGIWMLSIGFGPLGFALTGTMSAGLSAQLAITINGLAIIIAFFILLIALPRLAKI
jgi:MFS family permease